VGALTAFNSISGPFGESRDLVSSSTYYKTGGEGKGYGQVERFLGLGFGVFFLLFPAYVLNAPIEET